MNDSMPARTFARWQTRALSLGGLTAVISVIGGLFDHAQFFHSYLFAWLFWAGLTLGAMIVIMMHQLTGGLWGNAIRDLCLAAMTTLPLMICLFIPLLFALREIYPWANGILATQENTHHRQQYLNAPFFIVRSTLYFLILLVIAFLLKRRLEATDPARAPVALSAGGLISYILCMNFASTDWVMSLDPNWYSTVFVIVFMAGQFLAALSLTTALLCWFGGSDLVPAKVFHDLGNLLLAFVVFWAYVAFSQLLIIWSGNLPREIAWYLPRSRGGWQWLGLTLTAGEFLLPLALLLSREAKRRPRQLAIICICILGMNAVNNFWLVAPAFHPQSFFVHWLDFTELFALGGFWFALFFAVLKWRPLTQLHPGEITQHG